MKECAIRHRKVIYEGKGPCPVCQLRDKIFTWAEKVIGNKMSTIEKTMKPVRTRKVKAPAPPTTEGKEASSKRKSVTLGKEAELRDLDKDDRFYNGKKRGEQTEA